MSSSSPTKNFSNPAASFESQPHSPRSIFENSVVRTEEDAGVIAEDEVNCQTKSKSLVPKVIIPCGHDGYEKSRSSVGEKDIVLGRRYAVEMSKML